jgi:hypothetical protein
LEENGSRYAEEVALIVLSARVITTSSNTKLSSIQKEDVRNFPPQDIRRKFRTCVSAEYRISVSRRSPWSSVNSKHYA